MDKPNLNYPQDGPVGPGEPNSLANLMATTFKGLAEEGQTQHLETGSILMAEGQQATDLYILLQGQMEVLAVMDQDWVRVAELGPGTAIGEMAFLDGAPRSARVMASTPCSLLQITRESFQRFAKREPMLAVDFAMELGRILAFRLRRLEQFDTAEVAREYERKSLAAELHDQTLGDMGGLAVELGFLAHQASGVSEELTLAINQVRERLKETDQGLREIVQGIFPPVLIIMGLIPAVNSYLGGVAGRPVTNPHPMEVQFISSGFDDGRLDENLEISLYRVIQQGLANVIQHSQAKKASIELRWENNEVTLILTDDGLGFDVQNPKESPLTGHFGLANLRGRIEKYLGRMDITSEPGNGTTLRARIPLVGGGSGTGKTQTSTYQLLTQPTP